MSIAEFERFQADMKANGDLLAEFGAQDQTLETVLAFLAGRGYEISKADLMQVWSDQPQSGGSNQELSDDELDGVAGGFNWSSIFSQINKMKQDGEIPPSPAPGSTN